MPVNLSIFLSPDKARLLTIHQLFNQRGAKFTLEALTEALDEKGYAISERTLKKDLSTLRQEGFPLDSRTIELPHLREGDQRMITKQVSEHFYTRTISTIELVADRPEDLNKLLDIHTITRRYHELPVFKELEELFESLKLKYPDLEYYQTIDFDGPDQYAGIDNQAIEDAHYAISNRYPMTFRYADYTIRTPHEVIVHPYLIKEHNFRFYLIGIPQENSWQTEYGEFFAFSFDRMGDVNYDDMSNFERLPEFDPETFWSDRMGVRARPEGPQAISFEVKDGDESIGDDMVNIPYMQSAPWHHTQKIEQLDDTWYRVTFNVHITAELIRKVRSLGIRNVRNVEPAKLKMYL